ncbi:ATP-binding protein [Actinokineospora sp. NBRC 105648]|uniref:ATP-binding protein n=1 Tax=Actinokineospora sp. NBRC 105648 TaxID=3032206 RepID=UPI0024A1F843|nr:ATP-binding protein [Actinokineospora sp. NBRC 105648]GLZ42577.1 molecular chaperone Hsp90 [Actinokineospora sp. NBRC 105648]
MSAQADPFGTAALRAAVLSAWTTSPTRFREDANAEEDLYLGGYRDRLLVELAQNAADAAEGTGTLRVSLVDGELRAANTGRPLDADGVAALASLRASAKRSSQGVGQFGVGFAAVLAVSDEPSVLSADGGVTFSAAETRAAIAEYPELAARATERGGRVPVLRMVWPAGGVAPQGFATEVRLPLRPGVDGAALLADFAGQAEDLLLALPRLNRVEIGDQAWWRVDHPSRAEVHGPDGVVSWLVHRVEGVLSDDVVRDLGVEAQERPQWTVCWAARVDDNGVPQPLGEDVLHAPTPTDERLSLPARLVATLPIEPSRRRLRPGPAADAVLAEAARAYPDLIRLAPAEHRTALVPLIAFPLSEVDDRLRELLLSALRQAEWLPAAEGSDLAPGRAQVVDVEAEGLAELLAQVVPNLADGPLSAHRHAGALAALDVPRLRLADIVELITGTARPPEWWHRLYTALAPVIETDATARMELGGLPVPLADGRTLPGPSGVVLVDDAELLDLLTHAEVGALRVVHAEAAHPVLERLGAHHGGPVDLLDAGGLQEAVERSLDDVESGVDIHGLVSVVLRLVRDAGVRTGERPWLGALALKDSVGDWRRADELALPGSVLLDVLDEDAPVGVLSADLAAEWSANVLTALGVLDAFALVVDENPTAPDHGLADELEWWEAQPEPPARVLAVRDLDLVTDDAWPRALSLLAADPETWRALHEPNGYTGWWIARHAVLAGAAPTDWRLPEADDLVGLYDVIPDVGVDPRVLAAIGVRAALQVDNADDAEDLLIRLGDADRSVPPGAVLRTHAALAEAVDDDLFDPTDIRLPEATRTLAGTVSTDCVVLDAPWLLAVLDEDQVVSAGPDFALAEPLAELLDLPLATEEVGGDITSAAEPVPWNDLGAVAAACELLDVAIPYGSLLVHEKLTVHTSDGTHNVTWWVTDGVVHCEDTPEALARALAWTTDRWTDRHTFTALIEEPTHYLT